MLLPPASDLQRAKEPAVEERLLKLGKGVPVTAGAATAAASGAALAVAEAAAAAAAATAKAEAAEHALAML